MPATDDTLLNGLTEAQRAAVTHVNGPLLVLAGPGSGKTTVVTRRVAHLLSHDIKPWRILALTFTNRAAREMRERIARLLPSDDDPARTQEMRDNAALRGLTVSTFHSFCARLLRRYALHAGLAPSFSIYDTDDQRAVIKKALEEVRLSDRNFAPAAVAAVISNAKNDLLDAQAYTQSAGDFFSRCVAKAYQAYERLMKAANAVDFDDLLHITARLLKNNADVRAQLQNRYKYLLIDEYQDTNHAQFLIAHTLAAAHGNICVVGDPDQSIYGWRGADIENILEFEKHYPKTTVIPLGQNFRSTGHIVQAAAHLIQNNRRRKHKNLFTELGLGEQAVVSACTDEHDEANLIVDEIKRRNEAGTPWKEMAVLYRVNALSRVLEDAMRGAHIPHIIARGTAFYDRKEIRDALAYLRLLANPADDVSLRRIINVPARGIGPTTVDALELFATNQSIPMLEAARRAGQIASLKPAALNALRKFTTMIENWQRVCSEAASIPKEDDESSAGGRLPLPPSEGAVGRVNVQKPARGASPTSRLAALVESIIRDSGMEILYRNSKVEVEQERLANLEELVSAAAEFVPPAPDIDVPNDDAAIDDMGPQGAATERSLMDTLRAFLETVALVSDADAIDPANGAVTLLTLHAAKGLEFDVVCMAGLEEGLLPHSRSRENDTQLEEERRLCFVGMTRARRHLLITRAAWRTQRGIPERTIPSQFLAELPAEAVVISNRSLEDDDDDLPGNAVGEGFSSGFRSRTGFGRPDPSRSRTDKIRAPQWGGGTAHASRSLPARDRAPDNHGLAVDFPVGCLVRHPVFGVGRVQSVTPRPAGSAVRVEFTSVGPKTLITQYAKLTRVE